MISRLCSVIVALLCTLAATFKPNATEDQHMEQWDPASRRKALYEKVSKALIEKESKPGEPCQAIDWALAHFIDRYLGDAEAHAPSNIPDNWTINDHTEHYDLIEDFLNGETIEKNSTEFHDFMFKDYIKKYELAVQWEQKEKAVGRNYTNNYKFKGLDSTDELLTLNISSSGRWWWNSQWPIPQPAQNHYLNRKYEPAVVWNQIDKALGRNDSKNLTFLNGLHSIDELLNLYTLSSGRRWWNNQWSVPQRPHYDGLKKGDLQTIMLFMRQAIYATRNRMHPMQQLRQEYRETALYKMGYLFAKTDYACKVYSSLAFKAFRDCSMTKMKIFGFLSIYKMYMDQAYNIERLIAKWFDIDLLKDLLASNDMLARGVLLKDDNLTTPAMVVQAFNEMFID